MTTQTAPVPFQGGQQPSGRETLQSLLKQDKYRARFEQVLGTRAPQFISSILTLGPSLYDVEPKSILAACCIAAALDLPIERNFGFAHIVPYKKKGVKYASFQLGAKGAIQLALRTGAYKRMNALPINAEAYKGRDEVGEPVIDWEAVDSTKDVAYYVFAFQMINGFTKIACWSKARVETHAKRYSQAYKADYETPWKTHFDEMALKTVVSNELRRWGMMSVELQGAFAEEATVRRDIDAVPEYMEEFDAISRASFDGDGRTDPQDPEKKDEKELAGAGLAPAQQAATATTTPAPNPQTQPAAPAGAEAKSAQEKANAATAKARAARQKPPQTVAASPAPADPAPPATEPAPATTAAAPSPQQEAGEQPEPAPAQPENKSGSDLFATPESEALRKFRPLMQAEGINEEEVIAMIRRRGMITTERTLVECSDAIITDLINNIKALGGAVRIERRAVQRK